MCAQGMAPTPRSQLMQSAHPKHAAFHKAWPSVCGGTDVWGAAPSLGRWAGIAQFESVLRIGARLRAWPFSFCHRSTTHRLSFRLIVWQDLNRAVTRPCMP